ncbi:FtsK/SpoIIIE domain-containing protein [Tengunoibacter tsumagoiensis]|uniref:FtsK domain-containing protein n=1 Tax=Tengunoibacter tsumagoiensis TaxID=2014871 RepID=A0A401ZVI7_9CHLR|nr:FtsK/SpoIIIE domain-containing protein [Tengunoibacter tsumagoiensis]GCE10806.1 hypothetical protein KTT_06650 [Tengunoibacter tsumagoiensis]
MSEQQRTVITRKARLWPEIPSATIDLPAPPAFPNTVHPVMFIALICGMVGLCIYAVFFLIFLPRMSEANFFLGGLLTTSAFMLLLSVLSFFFQWHPTHKRRRELVEAYQQKLADMQIQLQAYVQQERQGRLELDPPLWLPEGVALPGYEGLSITPIIQRSLDNLDLQLWTRRASDPDFLALRLGLGQLPPSFAVQPAASLPADAELQVQVQDLQLASSWLIAPITVKLTGQNTTVLLGTQARLSQARQMVCLMLAHLAYHHSPEDVRIIVLAPESQRAIWDWSSLLPHTAHHSSQPGSTSTTRLPIEETLDVAHTVAIGSEAILSQMAILSRELSRRKMRRQEPGSQDGVPWLVVVVDHFDELEDLDQPTMFLNAAIMPFKKQKKRSHSDILNRPRLTDSPLQRSELALALQEGHALGVSVVSICNQASEIPSSAGLLVDLDQPQGILPSQLTSCARIRELSALAPQATLCQQLDTVPLETLHLLAMRMQLLRPAPVLQPEIRTQVDIRMLFEPRLDLMSYDPQAYWNEPSLRLSDGSPSLRIPIGLKLGDETQYLDIMKDGPHGLLTGQTGSGKSELLQTILAALAIAYRPGEVNFLLLDYNAGLTLEPFSQLPHTISFLSHVSSSAMIQRFMTMLRAEAQRREQRVKDGKLLPRLVIVIDEYAEIVRRNEGFLEEIFAITRTGREMGMHLLLASQRPEGSIGRQVRNAVQYRLCLRCSSPEESRDMLLREDAARLPMSIPGRGYLLHGDNQLDLFQAARVNVPALVQAPRQLRLQKAEVKVLPIVAQN